VTFIFQALLMSHSQNNQVSRLTLITADYF
jgi:hypothetical protein